MFCLILQTDSYLLLEFTGTCMNVGSPDSESLVWWLLSIFSQSDCGVTNQILTFILPTKQTYSISTHKKDERQVQTLQYLSGRSQMEGWCCFVFWRGKPACNLGCKTTTFWAGLVIYDRLTVSGSFSNTSLASSLEHLSSTHSLSKCPCFVSSKT